MEYNEGLITCDGIFSRIEEELSSFANSGLMDTGKFFPRIRLFIEKFGIGAYQEEEAVVVIKDYKVELPCDFYLLDSAWLCDNKNTFSQSAFQGEFQIYTTKSCASVTVGDCNYSPYYGIAASTCLNETVLDKVTITETINSEPTTITWQNPFLLSLGNKVTKNVCSKDCKNIFSKCPENISIRKQGDSFFLYSNMKDATIYLKYYAYPLDENQLPMIVDSPIIEEALFYDLMLYFFKQRWYNNEIVNVENKIKQLTVDRDEAMKLAYAYIRTPTFLKMVEIIRRTRKATMSYEIAFQNRVDYRGW